MKMATLIGRVLMVWAILSCQAVFAQGTSVQSTSSQAATLPDGPNGKAIMAYYTAFQNKDWNMIQPVLADGFTFSSPVDNHISVAAFKERCWPNCYKTKKFEIVQFIIQGDDAFVIINGWTTDGKLFRNSDCFKFKDGKITAYECFFGPGVNYPNSGK